MMTGNDYFCLTILIFIQKQLQETYYAIFKFFILFWVTIRVGLHALMPKKPFSYLTLSSSAALYSPLCLKRSVLARLFKLH